MLEQGFKIKASQNKTDELIIFRDKFEYSFQRLDIDPDQIIRNMSQKLNKKLNQIILQQQTLTNNDYLQSSQFTNNEPQEISDIGMDPEVSNMINIKQKGQQSNRQKRPSHQQRQNTFNTNSFIKNQSIQKNMNFKNIRSTTNILGRIQNDDQDNSYNDNSVFEIRDLLIKQNQGRNINLSGNLYDDKTELINWEQKSNKRLLEEMTEIFKTLNLQASETNLYLEKLSKKTKDFNDIVGKSYFKKFLKVILENVHVYINQTTFINLKNIIQKDLQQTNKCDFSLQFFEKLLISIGPYQFFELIFNYIYDKGFNSKNFVVILYIFMQNMPQELIYDGHLMILYRMMMLHNNFCNYDVIYEFQNLLENFIKNKIHYLRKSFPELAYIDFNKTREIIMGVKLQFPDFVYEEMQQMTIQQNNPDQAMYKVINLQSQIEDQIKFSKLNPNKKMKLLNNILDIFLKTAKFEFNNSKLDDKFQTLWYNTCIGNENNKNLMKSLSKIIYTYAFCTENLTFKLISKHKKYFISTFLKDKNQEVRKYFSLALRLHFQNVNSKEITEYCQILNDKSIDMRSELLDILYEYFDNQPEKNILQISKSKFFPYLFTLLQEKHKSIVSKTEEFLEFLLPFFKKKDLQFLSQKHSKQAYEFVNKFYLHTSNNMINPDSDEEYKQSQSIEIYQDTDLQENDQISDISRPITPNQIMTQKQNIRQTSKFQLEEDFFLIEELQRLQIYEIIQNLESIIEKVFSFQVSEIIRAILFEENLEYIDMLTQIIEKLLDPDYVLQNNVIPLILSMIYNLNANYPNNNEAMLNSFNLMLMFADGLKISNDEITSLMNEEFQLFIEIIQNYNLNEKQDLLNLDRLIQTIIIDHIEIEDQVEVLDFFNDIDQNQWLITCLIQEEIIGDLLKNVEQYNINDFDQLFFNIAFGTKNSILDILISNKFIHQINDEQSKNIMFVFIILLKRIKKSILYTDEVNEKFLTFVLDKIWEYQQEFVNDTQLEFLSAFLQELIIIFHLQNIQMNQKILEFIMIFVNSLEKQKLVQIGALMFFDSVQEDCFWQQIMVSSLENEDTQTLEDFGQILNSSPHLNQIGEYLVHLCNQKKEIEDRKNELPNLEKLIEEYNDFDWNIPLST